jgi:hypothetical protein
VNVCGYVFDKSLLRLASRLLDKGYKFSREV